MDSGTGKAEWRADAPGGVIMHVHGPLRQAAEGEVTVVSVVRNEADILPAFLQHYRSLGVRRFLFIDNESTDETPLLLRRQPDVTLFAAHGSYQQAYCGVAWSNRVAEAFCGGRWVLVADADEFLALPAGIEDLSALVERLRREPALGLYCAVVDFFARDADASPPAAWNSLEELLCAAPWFMPFEPSCLKRREHFPHADLQLEGRGIRAVLSNGRYMPRMNNMPLVFWRPGFRFTRSTHEAAWLPLSDLVGVFCHFKFRPGFASRARRRLRSDDRQNIQALSAYVEGMEKLSADHPALSGARKLRTFDDLVAAGWLSDIRADTPMRDSLPAMWPAANASRAEMFRMLAAADNAWLEADERFLERRADAALREVLRSPSARFTRPLRRMLMRHSLIRPEYVPEERLSAERDKVEVLHQFLTSWWWDVAWPLRLPRNLRMAVRWRRLWQLLRGRGRRR